MNLTGKINFVFLGKVATSAVIDIMASMSSAISTLASFIIAAETEQFKWVDCTEIRNINFYYNGNIHVHIIILCWHLILEMFYFHMYH
jgi:hypothetical protein